MILGVDVNAANARGQTAVGAAMDDGFEEVVAFLVERGAALPDARNTTPRRR